MRKNGPVYIANYQKKKKKTGKIFKSILPVSCGQRKKGTLGFLFSLSFFF